MIPTLETERLTLRGYTREDFPAFADIWGDPRVAGAIGIAPAAPDEAWGRLCRYVGHWHFLGYGTWAVEEKASGALIGEVGLFDFKRDLGADFASRPEHGWALAFEAQGKGYASEAVAASLEWGRKHFKPFAPFCMISPGNTPSLRVAEKAGYVEVARTLFKGAPIILFNRAVEG